MMYSCGSTCRMRWSAGMATALAASMTCCTSTSLTSRSRMATTPCEFRLRTWLPAMPANTEWISQPAMSSASPTARWMDCTVDSMFTTTPFFRPREGCEPRPTTSTAPLASISPTSATTFEVPISSPTISERSLRLATCHLSTTRPPADGKPARITQIHVDDFRCARGDDARGREHETIETLFDVLAAQPQSYTVVEQQLPGAALIELHLRQTHAGFHQ